MAEKKLIVVVEATAAMGTYWNTIVTDYLEKLVRSFCGSESIGQKPPATGYELALVMFTAHGPYCGYLVTRSGWTRNMDTFSQWLSALSFSGGGFNDAATAEGLAEALMMFSVLSNEKQSQQNVEMQRHCVLVAASNPFPLPTPVYRPQSPNMDQSDNNNIEKQTENRLSDAETVAKSFPQILVSLSVISPKQFPKLRAIYNAGKINPRSVDPPVDNSKNPLFLVLISENFMEARAALSRPGITNLPSNQIPVKMDMTSAPSSVVVPPPASLAANGSIMNRQPISVGNVPNATVKVEPNTVTSMVSGPTFSHMPSVPRPPSQTLTSLQTSSPPSMASQEMTTTAIDNVQDLKPIMNNISQSTSLRPVGSAAANVSILNNLSQARQVMNNAALGGGTSIGVQPMGATSMAMHMSNMISSSAMQSSIPAAQPGFTSSQSGITSMTGSGPQSSPLGSFTSATSSISGNGNLGMSQPLAANLQGVSMGQPISGMSQGNLQGGQMAQTGIGMNQNMMSGLNPPAISSGTMIPTPGMTQQVQQGIQPHGVNNNSVPNMPLSQQTSNAMQSAAQSKYVKVWEGTLSGQRQGQPVLITKLEGYRSASAPENLAANWPSTMQIVRLISQDHMNNKQYMGKADFLVFRAMNQHNFLGQLQEKKLCAVIQLPSQTLLLSVSDKACRLIGMLFPGDMVVFKPQMPSQQQQQLQQLQQQQQQHPQQQQQMVGAVMTQAYVQGPTRTQLVSQGQVPPQGPSTMPGGAFLS